MYEGMEKIEDINTVTMYKMIQALCDYDYYSTKCLVNELIQKRTKEQEIRNLKNIQELLFCQKKQELEELLVRIIHEEESKR